MIFDQRKGIWYQKVIFFPKSYTIAIELCIYIVFKCKRYLKANFFAPKLIQYYAQFCTDICSYETSASTTLAKRPIASEIHVHLDDINSS